MLLPAPLPAIRPARTLLAFVTITALILWHFHVLSSTQPDEIAEALTEQQSDVDLANSTLGFQTILAISSENASSPRAWRQHGLMAAANRTGLEIVLRQSRDIPEDELRAFRQRASKTRETPGAGSARAWLAHLDVLKFVFENNITTALILEDDADWDVRIRELLAHTAPIPSLIRNILSHPSGPSDLPAQHNLASSSITSSSHPFGADFDILWLGHCSSLPTPHSTYLAQSNDTTLPRALDLRALHDRYAYTPLPDFTRRVMRSPHPTCSYAYAVTQEGARRVIERASKGGAAFDNEVGMGCAAGEKKGGLRCVSVAPELFHHQRVMSKDGDGRESSLVDGMNWLFAGGSEGPEELKEKKVVVGKGNGKKGADKRRFVTFNVMFSTRCNVGRSEKDLVTCLPSEGELDRFTT